MHMRVARNAFGTQRESFEADLKVPALGDEPFRAVFIRAPAVECVDPGVEVLARLESDQSSVDGVIVAVREGSLLATAFHPEVTADLRFHDYFLSMVSAARH
jgi:5'-phosphate synthase pdxT subunit